MSTTSCLIRKFLNSIFCINLSKELNSIAKFILFWYNKKVQKEGINEILIISTPEDIENYKLLLGDGSKLGCKFAYKIQDAPNGLAEAFILGEEFIGDDNVCLILGDNVFYGQGFSDILRQAKENSGATIFGYPVSNPSAFGVVEFDNEGHVISLEEKPEHPKSKFAVPGLYFYDNDVVEIAKNVKPSARGEIEITSVNNEYLARGKLNVVLMGRGMAWLDTGTPKNMLLASKYVEIVQERQGYYISCIEEIAWRRGFITLEQLKALGEEQKQTAYGQYILDIAADAEKGLL